LTDIQADPARLANLTRHHWSFGYTGDEIVANLDNAGSLTRIWPVHAATQAAVLVNTRRTESLPAGCGGYLANAGNFSALCQVDHV
jgi:hypothetical protein